MSVHDEPPDDWNYPDDDEADESPAIGEQAARLREAWILAVRRHHLLRHGTRSRYSSSKYWDGGYDHRRKVTYKPKWPQLVRAARAAGADPLVLVEVLFGAVTTEDPPRADAIVSSENIARYHRHGPARAARVMNALRTEESVFRTATWSAGQMIADPKAAVPYVLNDLGLALSPLFRYSMALLDGRTDIAERWRREAESQFAAAPSAYRRYWHSILPPHMQGDTTEGGRT